MAQVDIKNARIYIKDGYAGPGGTGAVNNSGGYSAAAVTMKVDGFTGLVAVGDLFQVNSDSTDRIHTVTSKVDVATGTPLVNNGAGYSSGVTTVVVDGFTGIVYNGDTFRFATDSTLTLHTITSHSETLGATTSITFTPATAESLVDDDPITLVGSRTHSITFTPGLAESVADNDTLLMLPHQLEITVGEGNVTWTEKHAREYKLNRGRLDKVRDGNQDPLEVKTEFTWENITASTGGTPTPVDVLKNIGEASDWETAGSDPCEPFSVDLEILYTPICDTEQLERIRFPDFRFEQLDFDLQKGTCSLGGKCNVIEPVVTREDQ